MRARRNLFQEALEAGHLVIEHGKPYLVGSVGFEAEVLPARIPLAWILGIYGAGAVVVGSVERAKWLKRALKKKR